MKAKDLMTRDVVSLSPLTDLGAAARLMTDRRISGAPVVDAKMNILGVVSQSDLVRFQGGERPDGWDPIRRDADWPEAPEPVPVMAVMTARPVTCDEEAPVDEVARLMLERRVHRLLVTHGGKLVGIISAMDLLRAVPVGSPVRSR
jgi:CBS domain-containing protein